MTRTRKIVGMMHLWLGIITGPLVFIIALTGSIYAFQEEIKEAVQPFRKVAMEDRPVLPPSSMQHVAEAALPNKEVHAIMYGQRGRAAKAIFYKDGAEYYHFVYLNPYSGKVLQVTDEGNDFFRFILNGHYYLWLPPKIGHVLVASVTLIFGVVVVSGLVLWWPKNKGARKQRFRIKWDAQWRRKNYDLHHVLGFYVLVLALVFAITGLVWGFEWFSNVWYKGVLRGQKETVYREPKSGGKRAANEGAAAIDKIWLQVAGDLPANGTIEIHVPHDSAAAIEVAVNPDSKTYWKTDYTFYDQYTLEELPVEHMWGRYDAATNADKVMRMNYDIHVGAILGLPGKVLACLASLVIASLPITGFVIWWGRRKKSKKTKDGN